MENRELKFRVWDKKNKRWYRTELMFYGFHIFGECMLVCPPRIEDLGHLEVTQYTGRKDKKGKDIYSGDIINIDNSEPEENGEYDAIVIVENKDGWIFDLCNANGDGGTWTRQWHHKDRLTIIGNLYENPNLIKDIFKKK